MSPQAFALQATASTVVLPTGEPHALPSSTTLRVAWQLAAAESAIWYQVFAYETGAKSAAVGIASIANEELLSELKSDTAYEIRVLGCNNRFCSGALVAATVSVRTPAEVWKFAGNGRTIAGLMRVVSDGNARVSATRIGPDASSANADSVQLYYGPMPSPGGAMLAVATGTPGVRSDRPETYLNLQSLTGRSGIISPPSAGADAAIRRIATGQAVPLSEAMGGAMRLFFEAEGGDLRTRVWSIDSRDGSLGVDFNPSTALTCSTESDYAVGGGCAPTLAIGVDIDAAQANPRISNARQQKVGWRTQDDWRWDGAPGTFMVVTTGQISGCSSFERNHGYAQWDGQRWRVQYDAQGCPKLFHDVQACLPMHLGADRYKMYCGTPSLTSGRVPTSNLPFLGPKQLLYADGANSGASTSVEFEDWEAREDGRNVVFHWPDGSAMDDTAEGYIDDYHMLAPTGNLDFQLAYIVITDGFVAPFATAAILANP